MTHLAYMAHITAKMPAVLFFFFLAMVFKSLFYSLLISFVVVFGLTIFGIVGLLAIVAYTAHRDMRKEK